MGKVDRLRNRVESFAALFWLSALYLPTPDPARRPGITAPPFTKYVLIWSFGAILNEDALLPPPLSYLGVYFINDAECTVQTSILQCKASRNACIVFSMYCRVLIERNVIKVQNLQNTKISNIKVL